MNDQSSVVFPLHPLGYVQHWLVTGPHSILYKGSIKDDDKFRRDAVDFTQIEPHEPCGLGTKGPFNRVWQFHYSARNYFLEYSNFWSSPSSVDSYAWTQINSEQTCETPVRLWAAGSVDLWLNGTHRIRFDCPRYMHPDFRPVTLPLRRGTNHLYVRLQVAAIRDTRFLVGIQFLGTPQITIQIPEAAPLVDSINWLDRVKIMGNDTIVGEGPAPVDTEIAPSNGPSFPWPAGEKNVSLSSTLPFNFDVRIKCAGQTLERPFEIPANRNGLPHGRPGDVKQAHLDYIASAPDDGFFPGVNYSQLPLLARRLLGRTSPIDSISFATMIHYINERRDCSDFALAALLRLAHLGLASPDEMAEIRRTALAFRYWSDEPGADAMCFHTENHSLLFHGCQYMAGQLYPDDVFSNSGLKGKEHIALGMRLTHKWLEHIEANGFVEFLSSTYVPITAGALLNVVDFSGDPRLAQRASLLIDRLYEELADHAFRGLIVAPQGRVYRNVLYPEEAGTQALLSWATSEALPDFARRHLKSKERTGDWIAFFATSKNYRPPAGLEERMRRPVSRRYINAGVEIVLHKTSDYILTSLAVPRDVGSDGPRPGAGGYQEHLWQATLGTGCHIFVNHPGCSYDVDKLSRPGYWYGNGVLPVVRQREGVLQSIFHIPDGNESLQMVAPDEQQRLPSALPLYDIYPIPFTHAHWPSDAFEHQEIHGHWLFAWKQSGFIGLWCSERLKPKDDILSGRELRASGSRSAWVAICGGLSENPSFISFIDSCLARNPDFDRNHLVLRMNGEEPLRWPNRTVK
jgi:hypothetical protein